MKNENGAGSVYKLQGKRRKPWIARITTGYDKDGKQLRKTIGTYATKREGQIALLEYSKNPLLFNNMTFGRLKKLWWENKKNSYKNKTIHKTIKARLKKLQPLDELEIKDISLMSMQKVFDDMNASYSYKNDCKIALNLIIEYAVKNDFITDNKVRFIEVGKKETVIQRRIFTDWEISVLWNNLGDYKTFKKYVYAILILIYTGLRIGELLNLKTEDIDLKNEYLKVQESKTDAGKRTIPISKKILPLIKQYYNVNNKYFITSMNNGQLSYPAFRKSFMKIIKDLGLGEHTVHDTRHTFATLLNNADANKTSITKLIGHVDFNLTENVYTHKDLEELRKAIDLLN